MNTQDLINSIASGNTEESNSILDTMLRNKVKTEIETQRINVAQKVFNTKEIEESAVKTEEIEEGNEFTKAAAQAVIDGEEEFEFNGKTYKATLDKEVAKKILGIEDEES